MTVTYNYTKSPVDVGKLNEEILESSIVTALEASSFNEPDILLIDFVSALSGGEQTILNAVVGAHGGVAIPWPADLPTFGAVPSGALIISDGGNSTYWGYDSLINLSDGPDGYYEGAYLKSTASGTEWDMISVYDEFIELNDTPTTYSGYGESIVQVKEDETGLEFVTVSGHGYGIIRKYPPPPDTTRYWHDLESHMLYGYCQCSEQWLSVNRITYAFSKNTLNFKNAYISYGETNQAATGPLVPRPARIVGIYGRNDLVSSTRTIQLHDFTTSILEIPWPNKNLYWGHASDVEGGLNIDAGAILKFKVGPSNNDKLNYPTIYIEVAYRYDPTWDGTFPDGNDIGS